MKELVAMDVNGEALPHDCTVTVVMAGNRACTVGKTYPAWTLCPGQLDPDGYCVKHPGVWWVVDVGDCVGIFFRAPLEMEFIRIDPLH